MKKGIYICIIGVALPCIATLSFILIYLLYNETGRIEPVNYLVVSISIVALVGIITLFAANYAARKMTEKITSSLEKVGQENIDITLYDELMPFAGKIERDNQTVRAKIEDLSNRTETIETITDNMQEGLILTDSEGIILSANNSVQQIFGGSIVSKNVMHILRDDNFQSAVERCITGENAEIQMERNTRIYTVFFSPVHTGENARGAVILFHDATERQRAEKQRREFTANVSHELKTPLTTISALSEMIAQGIAKEDDINIFAGRINEQSGRLLVLIEDIIRLSEFDEGRQTGEITNFDLWELCETVINTFRDNTGNVEIILTGERFNISANSRMINELLYNLIDNGVKYNKENGNVTVELTHSDSGQCKISVKDTGIGIKEEHHEHVFERFYRAEKSRSKKTGGTGLGLSIVKHITEQNNGKLELSSTEGIGTTVICYL